MLALAEFIAERYRKVAEIGIGYNRTLAELLASKGVKVVATDIKEVKTGVEFHIDNIFKPKIEIYKDVELVYSIRPPPELFEPILELSRILNADCIIKPLYGDHFNGTLVNYKGVSFYLWRRNSI